MQVTRVVVEPPPDGVIDDGDQILITVAVVTIIIFTRALCVIESILYFQGTSCS